MANDGYEEANAEVEHILAASRPRHLGEGLTSGLGYILRGAVGACGAVVVSDTVARSSFVAYVSFSLSFFMYVVF